MALLENVIYHIKSVKKEAVYFHAIILIFKQYNNTVYVGIGAIVAPTVKNAASKNHPKDILRDKNHFKE